MHLLAILFLLLTDTDTRRFAASYELRRGYDQERLQLSNDHTFRLWTKSCTHNLVLMGNWRVERDTLHLGFERIMERRRTFVPYTMHSQAERYRKGVMRGDSLDLQWTNHGYHPLLALVRTSEPAKEHQRR